MKVSYNFVGDRDSVYDRTSPVKMTQMNPWPEQPATEIQLPDTDDFSHIIFFFSGNMTQVSGDMTLGEIAT